MNNVTRAAICKAVMSHKYTAIVDELQQKHAEIARLIYDKTFKHTVRMRMEELPEGWLNTSATITAKIVENDSYYASWNFSGVMYRRENEYRVFNFASKREPVQLRFPYKDAGKTVLFGNATGVGAMIVIHIERMRAFNNEFTEAERKLTGILSSYTTVGKLLDAWPEMLPFVPAAPEPKQALVLPTAELNTMFGLPV